jgi:hypothetical protein
MSMTDPRPMNDPRPPRGPDYREPDDSSMWLAAGLVAVVMLSLVFWGATDRPHTASTNPPVTTGQGNSAPAAPTTPAPPSPPR